MTANYLLFEGDSITNGFDAAIAYPALVASYQTVVDHVNHGTNSRFISQSLGGSNSLEAQAATDDLLLSGHTGITILCVLCGTNDLASIVGIQPISTVTTNLKNYCLARRTAGWKKIIVGTYTSRTGGGNYDSNLAALNTIIYGDNSFYDTLMDFGADPNIGAGTGGFASATYFADGLHPTTFGQTLMAAIASAAVSRMAPVYAPIH